MLAFPDCTDAMRAVFDGDLRAIVPALRLGPARPGTRGLLLLGTRLDTASLDAMPGLRLVVCLSTGVSSWVDLDAAAARGVAVHGVRGYGDRAVAEHALALILSSLRHVAAMDRALRAGLWRPVTGGELAGKRLGIVGLGGTGRALAGMGAALGCEVLGWNRTARDVPGVRMLPLDALLAAADIVSLHLLLTSETRGLLDARRIGLLRPGALLVNTARGGLLDEAALVARLAAGTMTAALDVFADEPLAPDHPLPRLDTVTLSPHVAWNTDAAMRRLLHRGLLTLRDAAAALGISGGEGQPAAP